MKKWERIEIRNNIDEIELTIDSIVVFRFFKINLVNYPVIKGYILDFIGGAINQAIMEKEELKGERKKQGTL